MRNLFFFLLLAGFIGANNVAVFIFCPGFSSQDNIVLTAKMVVNGITNCSQPFNLTVIDPVGNSSQYSGSCKNSTGITTFTVLTSLGGPYTIETTNATNPGSISFKHDYCTFNSLKKNKVSIPDSNYVSLLVVFAVALFVYTRRK